MGVADSRAKGVFAGPAGSVAAVCIAAADGFGAVGEGGLNDCVAGGSCSRTVACAVMGAGWAIGGVGAVVAASLTSFGACAGSGAGALGFWAAGFGAVGAEPAFSSMACGGFNLIGARAARDIGLTPGGGVNTMRPDAAGGKIGVGAD